MREKLIELLGLDARAGDDEILSFAGQLMRMAKSPGAKQEKAIREKMAAGLSRESAIQVLEDQARDDDARLDREEAEEEARAKKAKADAAAGLPPKGSVPTPNP